MPGFSGLSALDGRRESRRLANGPEKRRGTESSLLSSKNAADLSVLETDINDDIPPSAMDIVTRAVANSPANFAGTVMLRCCDPAAVDLYAFAASPSISGGHCAS